jgi:hypothetical protein
MTPQPAPAPAEPPSRTRPRWSRTRWWWSVIVPLGLAVTACVLLIAFHDAQQAAVLVGAVCNWPLAVVLVVLAARPGINQALIEFAKHRPTKGTLKLPGMELSADYPTPDQMQQAGAAIDRDLAQILAEQLAGAPPERLAELMRGASGIAQPPGAASEIEATDSA